MTGDHKKRMEDEISKGDTCLVSAPRKSGVTFGRLKPSFKGSGF